MPRSTVTTDEVIALPALSVGATAREMLRVVDADPHCRAESVSPDVYRITSRERPAWAAVLGWATAVVLIGFAFLAIRTTVGCTATVGPEGGRTGLRLKGRIRTELRDALRALSVAPGFAAPAAAGPVWPPAAQPAASSPAWPPAQPGTPAPPPFVPEPPSFVPEQPRPGDRDEPTSVAWQRPSLVDAVQASRAARVDQPVDTTIRRQPERSRHAAAPAGRVLVFDSGRRLAVGALGLVGRDPAAAPGEAVEQVVRLDGGARSVSKTHFAFGRNATGVWVADRHSTNGTTVRQAGGAVVHCEPGTPVYLSPGDTVTFGDHDCVLEAE